MSDASPSPLIGYVLLSGDAMSRFTLRRFLLPLMFFVGIACLSLYMPLLHPDQVGSTLPTDYYHFHWNYWWIRHALATGQSIYETNYVLAPATINLAYHTLTPFWYPVWAVLEPLAGTITAMNTVMVAGSSLTGWLFYLLLRRERVSQPLALAGGIILQITPAMLFSAWLTNINYLSLFWYPALLLLWGKVAEYPPPNSLALRERDLKDHAVLRETGGGVKRLLWSLLFGMALYGMMMTDYQHALFAAFLLIPYSLWTLTKSGLTPILSGALSLGVALLLLWFVGPLPYLLAFDRSSLSPQPIANAFGLPFPAGYISRLSPYLRALSLGAVPLLAAAAALVLKATRRIPKPYARPHWLWLWMALPPLILSLGPSITIAGTDIATPYVAFHNLFGGLFRVPARFAPVVLIPVLIFAGQTLSMAIKGRRIHLLLWAGVMLLVLAESRLFEPMPLRPLPTVYNFYHELAREPYDYVILDVPVAGGSGEAWVGEFPPMETQFYALTHGKRVVNGSVARAPLSSFWHWLYDDPMLAWLGQRRYLEQETVRAQLAERIEGYPIGYIVIHQNYMNRSAPTIQEIVGFFNQLDNLLCFYAAEGDAIVYRTRWHPDSCDALTRIPAQIEPAVYQADIGTPGDERFIGWGYHWAEQVAGLTLRWTGEYPQTDTYVDLPPGSYDLTISMQAFWENRLVSLQVNGADVGDPVEVGTGTLANYRWHLPADLIGDGQHLQIRLIFDRVVVPAEVGQSGDTRRLAVAVDWLRFTLREE
jgi:hypothetical protein